MEDDDFIDTVNEFRTEVMAYHTEHQLFHVRIIQFTKTFLNQIGTEVRGHNDDRITEVDRSPLPVSQTPIIQYLQQNVEDIRMRFFHFIQQDDGIRTTTHRFGQVATFFITDISRRRTNQTRHRVFLHKLGHIDTDHRLVAIKHKVCQRLTKLCFPHTRWAEEQE